MKKTLICAAALCLALPVSAKSADKEAGCEMYSKVGSAMVDFMLPLTMQDFVDMMTGKNPELMEDMTKNLLTGLNGTDLLFMTTIPAEDAEAVGMAAGDVAMQILMAGQANSASGVQTLMKDNCTSIGFETIVANQKRANAAKAANYGK